MAAMRTGSRLVFRRLSTGGKVLSEEEKAAENVYIKVLHLFFSPSFFFFFTILVLFGFKYLIY